MLTALLLTASTALAQTSSDDWTLGSTLNVPMLADLPTGGSLYSVFDTMPAEVISDRIDTGGLFTGELARIGSHGSSWTQTMFRIGDADVTNPYAGGTPLLVPGAMAWDRVDIASGLMPIEVNAPGMAVSLTPRRPSDKWIRTFEVFAAGPSLLARQETTDPPAIARQHSWNSGNLFLSGPVIPNRLSLMFVSGWTSSSRFERSDPTRLDSAIGNALGHVVFAPNQRDEIRVLGWVERSRVPYVNRVAFSQPLSSEGANAVHTQVTWERRATPDTLWAIFGSFGRRAQTNDLEPQPTLVVERLRDGPISELLHPLDGSEASWSVGARMKRASVTIFDRSHAVRGGIVLSGAQATTHSTFDGRIGELVDGVPARVWDFTSPPGGSDWHSGSLAIYAADTVPLHPRLTLDAGIRFEAVRGSADGSIERVRWHNWFPRGSLRWGLTEYGNISAFAGFSRYGHRLLVNELATGDPNAPYADVYRWNVANADMERPNPGPLISRVGPGTGGDPRFAAIDPQLSRPYMDEFVTGFEGRPRADAVIRLAAIARRDKRVMGVVNVGVPQSMYSTTLIPDPGDDHAGYQTLPVFNRPADAYGLDRYLLTNPPDNQATFVGVELTMQATIRRLTLMFGATAGRSYGISGNIGFGPLENDHGILGEVFIDPNARTNADGRIFSERGYTIKTAGVFPLPWNLRVGYAARYQDGQHFARLVIVSDLNQGTSSIRAFRNGETRFTMTPTLDARVQKLFTVAQRPFAILFDAYNVLNHGFEVEEYQITGPTSRLPSAVQPPRAVHLGLRFSF